MGSCCSQPITALHFPLLELPDDILCLIMRKTLCMKDLALVCQRFAGLASRYLVVKMPVTGYISTDPLRDGNMYTFKLRNTCSNVSFTWRRPVRGLRHKNGRVNRINAGILHGSNVIVNIPILDGANVIKSVVNTTWYGLQPDQRAAIIIELKNGLTAEKWGFKLLDAHKKVSRRRLIAINIRV
jgi:hypothetical protein